MTFASSHSLHALRGEPGKRVAAAMQPWLASGLLFPAEVALAARIAALAGAPSFPLTLAFALALRADRLGSALVDLAAVDVQRLLDERESPPAAEGASPTLPGSWHTWRGALAVSSRLVACVQSGDRVGSAGPATTTPFVLDDSRLYTARGWSAELRVAEGVRRLMGKGAAVAGGEGVTVGGASEAWAAVEAGVLALIGGAGAEEQRAAARSAVAPARLQVVTGGPGTGKTFTVRAMLTLAWLRSAWTSGATPRLDVQLAAPTGKAAQRMKEAMGAGLESWCHQVSQVVPAGRLRGALATAEGVEGALHAFLATLAARTLHRLLGYQHFNPTRFRHDRHNPLAADLVVVDEASMVDLTMMAHLFDAVGDTTRLVLVGDRRQLASVDTGTVLADLCAWGGAAGRPLVELRASRRFPTESAVGRFAQRSEALDALEDRGIREAARDAVSILADAAGAAGAAPGERVIVRWLDAGPSSASDGPEKQGKGQAAQGFGRDLDAELDAVAAHWVSITCALARCVFRVSSSGALSVEGDGPVWSTLVGKVTCSAGEGDVEPALVLARLAEQVRVLTAHRKGHRGVGGLNQEIWKRIEQQVRELPEGQRPAGVLGKGTRDPVIGKPVLVTKNDYSLGRFNGDVGLWVKVRRAEDDANLQPTLMALFPREGGGAVAHSATRLPAHEAVWAMTVHKSQGSEFDKVVFVLPERVTSLWTRELVYTGITRVKRELVLVGRQEILAQGLERRVQRASGLQRALEAHPADAGPTTG